MCFDGRKPEADALMRSAGEPRGVAPARCPACSSREVAHDPGEATRWACRGCGLRWRRPEPEPATPPRTFAVGDRVVKDPSGWIASEFDAWGAGEGVGEVVDADDTHVDVRWPGGRAYQLPSELLPAPTPPEDRGTPLWVWRDVDGWPSFERPRAAAERCEVSAPIGRRLATEPTGGVVLTDVFGARMTAARVLRLAERGEGGFRLRGREAVG